MLCWSPPSLVERDQRVGHRTRGRCARSEWDILNWAITRLVGRGSHKLTDIACSAASRSPRQTSAPHSAGAITCYRRARASVRRQFARDSEWRGRSPELSCHRLRKLGSACAPVRAMPPRFVAPGCGALPLGPPGPAAAKLGPRFAETWLQKLATHRKIFLGAFYACDVRARARTPDRSLAHCQGNAR